MIIIMIELQQMMPIINENDYDNIPRTDNNDYYDGIQLVYQIVINDDEDFYD